MLRLLLVSDCFPPSRISGAVQMRDLAAALVGLGFDVTVVTPDTALKRWFSWSREDGIEVVRVKCPRTKDVSLLRRAFAEHLLPYFLGWAIRRLGLYKRDWGGIVSYSPSIFLGVLTRALKRKFVCRSYLILRDIFPDWAVDSGLLQRTSWRYCYFKWIQGIQYNSSDVIGVQSESNRELLADAAVNGVRVEVLHNWLAAPRCQMSTKGFSALTPLLGRQIFVYAGNMGIAQDLMPFVEAARSLHADTRIGFLFVGRGSMFGALSKAAEGLNNIVFLSEVAEGDLYHLLQMCAFGIVALDPRHQTHNIPGKLLTYLYSGLPVLVRSGAASDLAKLVIKEKFGAVVSDLSADVLGQMIVAMASGHAWHLSPGRECIEAAERCFSPRVAALQIIQGLALGESTALTHL